MAPRRRQNKNFLDTAAALKKGASEATVLALRKAAVEIMNDLAKIGPQYSGEFSSAWYAVLPSGSPGQNRSSGREYKYDLRNVPKVAFKDFKEGTVYEIVNGMDYAPQALDLEPGTFIQPEEEPIKEPVNRGKRVGNFRYEVTGQEIEGPLSTAEANWYNTYTLGGRLRRSFNQGVKLGFRQARRTADGGFS